MSRAPLVLLTALALAGCARTTPRQVEGPVEVASRSCIPPHLSFALHPATGPPCTRAERSGFTETSRYADVVAFLDTLHAAGRAGGARCAPHAGRCPADTVPPVRVTTFGTTGEGRALPLAVWGAPDTTAAAVRATGKTRVLVLANIHAGEVDGKEALLTLLRDLARGHDAAWADSLVLLAAPIYNADGNERIAYDNRPLQYGPVGGMGVRANAQGLDLNRDFVKADAPETRALLGVLRDYDPHVVVDLHTTDGTPMAYALTYAPPLHPNTEAGLDREAWGRWLPDVTDVAARGGFPMWHYGNVPGAFGEPATAPRGWYTFDHRPRFSTNYAGLRNRFGFLGESYSYAPFERRIAAGRTFVAGVLDYAYRNATRVRRLTEAADAAPVAGDSLALRAAYAALPDPHEVLLSHVDTLAHPVTGSPMRVSRETVVRERMPAYVRFAATASERAPAAYLIPHDLPDVTALLDRHGIRHEPVFVWGFAREAFRVDSVRVADRPFQGRRGVEVAGRWEAVPAESGPPPRLAEFRRVPLDQPLGRLAFSLLEPRSDDGVVAWGLVPPERLRDRYPILRVP